MFNSHDLRNNVVDFNTNSESGTSYEVFRNHTTAVDVIIKDVHGKRRRKAEDSVQINDTSRKMSDEVIALKTELNDANNKLETTKTTFRKVINEMTNHVQVVSNRDLESQMKIMNLQLENEKLKALLESKSSLVGKLRRELINTKNVLKFVTKGLTFTPALTQNSITSEIEYKEFEKDLRNISGGTFSLFMSDEKTINDSTILKDLNTRSFE